MTDQTTRKVTILTPEEWKHLAIVNTAQLQNYLQTIPGNTEGGVSGLTDQHMAIIDGHLGRFGTFLHAWKLARAEMPATEQPQQPAQASTNGAAEPKPARKGGWPKGKKRAPKGEPAVPQ